MATCTICYVYVVNLPSGQFAIIQANKIPAPLLARYGLAALEHCSKRTFHASIAGDVEFPEGELTREQVQTWVDERERHGELLLGQSICVGRPA